MASLIATLVWVYAAGLMMIPSIFRPSLLNPGHQLPFTIRLAEIHLHSQLICQLRDGGVYGIEG